MPRPVEDAAGVQGDGGALPRRGARVIIDVVYNHTAEGNELGPTLSFKGIDNASYYRLIADNRRYYINDTGTGNTLNLSHPVVIQMVCDSLRYWAEEMHVDGFRFDLGTILAREPSGFDTYNGFMKAVMQDPVLAKVKLIAEPWDCGPGGYQLGRFPPGGRSGTTSSATRCATTGGRSHAGRARAAVVRLARHLQPPRAPAVGERQLHHRARRLHSLRPRHVQRQAQRGEPRGQQGRPFAQPLVEPRRRGPTDDEAIRGLRKRQMKNMLATLLLSQGTPMLLAGDEFGRSQRGNNNAYCQDNEISWLRWVHDDRAQRLIRFVQKLIGLRSRYPILRRPRFPRARSTRSSA